MRPGDHPHLGDHLYLHQGIAGYADPVGDPVRPISPGLPGPGDGAAADAAARGPETRAAVCRRGAVRRSPLFFAGESGPYLYPGLQRRGSGLGVPRLYRPAGPSLSGWRTAHGPFFCGLCRRDGGHLPGHVPGGGPAPGAAGRYAGIAGGTGRAAQSAVPGAGGIRPVFCHLEPGGECTGRDEDQRLYLSGAVHYGSLLGPDPEGALYAQDGGRHGSHAGGSTAVRGKVPRAEKRGGLIWKRV